MIYIRLFLIIYLSLSAFLLIAFQSRCSDHFVYTVCVPRAYGQSFQLTSYPPPASPLTVTHHLTVVGLPYHILSYFFRHRIKLEEEKFLYPTIRILVDISPPLSLPSHPLFTLSPPLHLSPPLSTPSTPFSSLSPPLSPFLSLFSHDYKDCYVKSNLFYQYLLIQYVFLFTFIKYFDLPFDLPKITPRWYGTVCLHSIADGALYIQVRKVPCFTYFS